MSFADKRNPQTLHGPPEPQLWQLRDPKVTLPTPARQTGAKQAPYSSFHVAAMPRQRGGGRCLPCSSAGIPPGDAAMAGPRGHLPGDAGVRAASPGAAGKAPCREEALRLPTGSAAASVPPPPPGASSCPVRRDLPPEQEKRNESDGAHGPPAPPGGEGVTTQRRSPPVWLPLCEQDTPPGTKHLPLAPASQG